MHQKLPKPEPRLRRKVKHRKAKLQATRVAFIILVAVAIFLVFQL